MNTYYIVQSLAENGVWQPHSGVLASRQKARRWKWYLENVLYDCSAGTNSKFRIVRSEVVR